MAVLKFHLKKIDVSGLIVALDSIRDPAGDNLEIV
jgi:hypothetical protein